MTALSDEQLIEAWRSAKAEEQRTLLEELCARHYRRVSLWCLRFTGEREQALDVAQDVFVTLCRKLHTFQGSSRFTTWLYTLTRNHCLNSLQGRPWTVQAGEDETAMEAVAAPDAGPDELAEMADTLRHAKDLLAEALDAREQSVFLLHFAEGMPLDAITRLLKLNNASGAKAYIVSAKRKLAIAVRRRQAQWGARTGGEHAE